MSWILVQYPSSRRPGKLLLGFMEYDGISKELKAKSFLLINPNVISLIPKAALKFKQQEINFQEEYLEHSLTFSISFHFLPYPIGKFIFHLSIT
jgi:hypothetical protein